ncbi:hypothetical protein [Streptomyces sp. NPDC101178]|uniref:hypothetical protein n=1 Tax=Streptomyces sp. NPDC101178 TaxID=3366124 RepID=UPI00380655D4
MAASRAWVGAHYPPDAIAGLAIGALIASTLALLLSRQARTAACLFGRAPPRPLITAS